MSALMPTGMMKRYESPALLIASASKTTPAFHQRALPPAGSASYRDVLLPRRTEPVDKNRNPFGTTKSGFTRLSSANLCVATRTNDQQPSDMKPSHGPVSRP